MGVESGRGGRIRTRDLRFWRPLLCQLSYAPIASVDSDGILAKSHPWVNAEKGTESAVKAVAGWVRPNDGRE